MNKYPIEKHNLKIGDIIAVYDKSGTKPIIGKYIIVSESALMIDASQEYYGDIRLIRLHNIIDIHKYEEVDKNESKNRE